MSIVDDNAVIKERAVYGTVGLRGTEIMFRPLSKFNGEGVLCNGFGYCENRCRSADLVSSNEKRIAFIGLSSALMKSIPSGPRSPAVPSSALPVKSRLLTYWTKVRLGRIRHIVDHNTTDALKTDKSVNAIADGSDSNTFGFRAFIIAAIIKRVVFVIGGIEIFWNQFGSPLFQSRCRYQRRGVRLHSR